MKRAIELIRVSTESQASSDRSSIPAQRAINRRTASVYWLSIVRSIELFDVSGTAVLKAPEIQELLNLMEDVEIHGVIAREFSRLMRPEDFGDYALLQAFANTKTILYLPEGPIDFASKTGRLMGTIRAAIAGMERTEILERIWSAKEEKRRAGGFAQAKICLPFGVDYPTGPSERPQSAPAPTNSLSQAALSHCCTPPQTKTYVFDHLARRFFLPHHPPATQLSFPTSDHATPLFHSIPIDPPRFRPTEFLPKCSPHRSHTPSTTQPLPTLTPGETSERILFVRPPWVSAP
ncbi:MAG: recombinase family protein [Pyrinomonadaceae bacterium]